MATFNENGSGGAVITHPVATIYTYSYGFKPNLSAISFGIRDSAMTDQHWCEMTWRKKDDELEIAFFTALSAGDKTILDGVVAAEAAKLSDHGYFYHDRLPQFQISTTTWTQRGTMNLELDPGTYRLGIVFIWAYSNSNNLFNGRIRVTGAETFTAWNMSQRPVTGNLSATHLGSGFSFRNLIGGNYDVSFEISCSNNAHTAQVEDVRLEVLSVDGVEL